MTRARVCGKVCTCGFCRRNPIDILENPPNPAVSARTAPDLRLGHGVGGVIMEGRKLAENENRHKPVPPDVCLPGEVWRDVVGYEGLYSVSDEGRIYGHKRGGRVLRTPLYGHGYRYINASKCGVVRKKKVHHIVCEAFNGPRKPGQVCRHLDGNQHNNIPSNLKWGTPTENAQDAIRHGTHICLHQNGQKNTNAKLLASQVIEIRQKAKSMTQTAIAIEYGISQQNVDSIIKRKSWRHI